MLQGHISRVHGRFCNVLCSSWCLWCLRGFGASELLLFGSFRFRGLELKLLAQLMDALSDRRNFSRMRASNTLQKRRHHDRREALQLSGVSQYQGKEASALFNPRDGGDHDEPHAIPESRKLVFDSQEPKEEEIPQRRRPGPSPTSQPPTPLLAAQQQTCPLLFKLVRVQTCARLRTSNTHTSHFISLSDPPAPLADIQVVVACGIHRRFLARPHKASREAQAQRRAYNTL